MTGEFKSSSTAPAGWVCSECKEYVQSGAYHMCPARSWVVKDGSWVVENNPGELERIATALERIAAALEKNKTVYKESEG